MFWGTNERSLTYSIQWHSNSKPFWRMHIFISVNVNFFFPVYCVAVDFLQYCWTHVLLQLCSRRRCCLHCLEVGPSDFRPVFVPSTCLRNPSPLCPLWGLVLPATTTVAQVGLKKDLPRCAQCPQDSHRYDLCQYCMYKLLTDWWGLLCKFGWIDILLDLLGGQEFLLRS